MPFDEKYLLWCLGVYFHRRVILNVVKNLVGEYVRGIINWRVILRSAKHDVRISERFNGRLFFVFPRFLTFVRNDNTMEIVDPNQILHYVQNDKP